MIQLVGCNGETEDRARLADIAVRLARKDPSIWGAAAQAEASIRLDWVDLPHESRDLLPILDALSAWSRELRHETFILCGMGGSSLAPEVIAQCFAKELVVLDATDPNQVRASIPDDLSRSCIIVGSKSGSTIETASQKSLFISLLNESSLDPRDHMVIITDPGSPLDREARAEGLKVVNANPNVGGRFSALSAFGLTPAALIGVDISLLLDDAADAASTFSQPDSVAIQMAAFLKKYRYVGFCDRNSQLPGISDWIEQLVAESTGKDGRGVLPIVVESSNEFLGYPVITFDGKGQNSVTGPLGAHFIFWEWVTALLCYLLEVDPFNQPNVSESKERTGAVLKGLQAAQKHKEHSSESITVFAEAPHVSLTQALQELQPVADGYLAIMAYLDRIHDGDLVELRKLCEEKFKRPVTFGWGPRFLHSTGQFHKGGPLVGSFLQLTGSASHEIKIPGREFGFGELVMAQAQGDQEALSSRGLKVTRIHLNDRKVGIAELLSAVRAL